MKWEIATAVFGILGAFFIITGIIVPADYVSFEYQYPELSWFVTATPRGIGIVGTGPQGQQLQIAVGFIFIVVAYLIYQQRVR